MDLIQNNALKFDKKSLKLKNTKCCDGFARKSTSLSIQHHYKAKCV